MNAFHLGRLIGNDRVWMHAAGLVYAVLGVAAIVFGLLAFIRGAAPRTPLTALFVARAVVGAVDVVFTKSDIHVHLVVNGVFAYSVGSGYVFCSAGGPLAFASLFWLARARRRYPAGEVRRVERERPPII